MSVSIPVVADSANQLPAIEEEIPFADQNTLLSPLGQPQPPLRSNERDRLSRSRSSERECTPTPMRLADGRLYVTSGEGSDLAFEREREEFFRTITQDQKDFCHSLTLQQLSFMPCLAENQQIAQAHLFDVSQDYYEAIEQASRNVPYWPQRDRSHSTRKPSKTDLLAKYGLQVIIEDECFLQEKREELKNDLAGEKVAPEAMLLLAEIKRIGELEELRHEHYGEGCAHMTLATRFAKLIRFVMRTRTFQALVGRTGDLYPDRAHAASRIDFFTGYLGFKMSDLLGDEAASIEEFFRVLVGIEVKSEPLLPAKKMDEQYKLIKDRPRLLRMVDGEFVDDGLDRSFAKGLVQVWEYELDAHFDQSLLSKNVKVPAPKSKGFENFNPSQEGSDPWKSPAYTFDGSDYEHSPISASGDADIPSEYPNTRLKARDGVPERTIPGVPALPGSPDTQTSLSQFGNVAGASTGTDRRDAVATSVSPQPSYLGVPAAPHTPVRRGFASRSESDEVADTPTNTYARNTIAMSVSPDPLADWTDPQLTTEFVPPFASNSARVVGNTEHMSGATVRNAAVTPREGDWNDAGGRGEEYGDEPDDSGPSGAASSSRYPANLSRGKPNIRDTLEQQVQSDHEKHGLFNWKKKSDKRERDASSSSKFFDRLRKPMRKVTEEKHPKRPQDAQ